MIEKTHIDLDALGFGFDDLNDFLRAARILEDIGVMAYSGAAALKTPEIITTAGCLLAAEAEHAAGLRAQIARRQMKRSLVFGTVICRRRRNH